jgi:hypothetical protein
VAVVFPEPYVSSAFRQCRRLVDPVLEPSERRRRRRKLPLRQRQESKEQTLQPLEFGPDHQNPSLRTLTGVVDELSSQLEQ